MMFSKSEARDGSLVLLAILLLVVLGFAIWVVTVALAPVTGQGEAYRQKESANNRIFAQAYFLETSEQITSTKVKIASAAAVKDPTPEQVVQLTGLKNFCTDLVADYNAKSRSYTTEQFKDADLPATFDAATECETA